MASEREEVLHSLASPAPDVPKLLPAPNIETALSAAESTRQLQLSQQHEMDRLNAELGWFGKVFGSESHAAIVIAFIVIVLGFGTAIGLWIAAYRSGKTDFWSSEAHIALAAATSALGYVFGRGSRDSSK